MTRLEFLEELTNFASSVQWNLYRGKELRTLNGRHCPISFVAWKKVGSEFNYEYPLSAADLIGLVEDDAVDIVMAADHNLEDFSTLKRKELRKQLIEITKPLQTVDT